MPPKSQNIMGDPITSTQNPRVKLADKLHDKRQRDREKLFVVDSGRDLIRALTVGYTPAYVLYCETLADEYAHTAITHINPAQRHDVTPQVLTRASYRQNPTGIVAVLHQHNLPTIHTMPPSTSMILCLVNLQKPGNIGALLRTADATGVHAVILIDTTLDIYNPNLIRSSTGACFNPHIYTSDSSSALYYLQQHDYHITSAHLAGTVAPYDLNFNQPTAFIMGNEAHGLPPLWYDACHTLAKIPMLGTITDSLNVSVAGAIFMYEALRQKQKK